MTAIIAFLKKWIFVLIGFIFVLSLSFIKGCSYGKGRVKCPTFTTTTITVHDTVIHNIVDTFPYYIQGKTQIVYRTDTIYKNIDTIAVVRDYFSTHITDNRWQDSLVQVDIKTYISENELKHSIFKYKILRDQTIINNVQDNSVHYVSYLYLGGSIPINKFDYSSIDLTLSLPKWYLGGGYIPGQNIFVAKGGIKLLQFKKK